MAGMAAVLCLVCICVIWAVCVCVCACEGERRRCVRCAWVWWGSAWVALSVPGVCVARPFSADAAACAVHERAERCVAGTCRAVLCGAVGVCAGCVASASGCVCGRVRVCVSCVGGGASHSRLLLRGVTAAAGPRADFQRMPSLRTVHPMSLLDGPPKLNPNLPISSQHHNDRLWVCPLSPSHAHSF